MRKDEGKRMTRFLKERGSFSAWRKNFKKHYGKHYNLEKWCKDVSFKDCIGSGFFFHETMEGSEYWFDLMYDWHVETGYSLFIHPKN